MAFSATVALFSALLLAKTTLAVFPAPSDLLWPLPVKVTDDQAAVPLAGDFAIVSAADSALLRAGLLRAEARLAKTPSTSSEALVGAPSAIRRLTVLVANTDDALPPPDMHESYELDVPASGPEALLRAETVWGALRGLETFTQLVVRVAKAGEEAPVAAPALAVPACRIYDAARFPYRSFMVDTARVFYSTALLKRTLDAMEFTKYNVMHWHIVDAESFPLELANEPLLAERGAFSPGSRRCEATDRCTYNAAEVAEIVEYARLRGIRVIPEMDSPGHTYSWGLAFPDVTVECGWNINSVPLSPITTQSDELIRTVIDGTVALFPDPVFHQGADEVIERCWLDDDAVSKELERRNTTTREEYIRLVLVASDMLADELDRRPMCWEDTVVDNQGRFIDTSPIRRDTLVHVWRKQATLHVVADREMDTVLSAGWYVVGERPGELDWKEWYLNEPFSFGGPWTPEQRARVFGGGPAKWGCSNYCPRLELEADFDPQVWPIVAVAAERLWSPETTRDLESAGRRLALHRDRLRLRGVHAGPLSTEL